MIFWKHIKGLNINNIYSFLRFNGSTTPSATAYITKNYSNLPEIVLSDNTTFGAGNYQSYGHILTTDVVGGYFHNEFTFQDTVHFMNNNPGNSLNIYFNANKWLLDSNQTILVSNNFEIGGIMSISNNTDSSTSEDGALVITGGVGIGKKLNVKGSINTDSFCQASYFNATSDYRAKKDFKPLDIDALELIKKVQLYSFKYKESNQPSIGIIAQDVQDIDINGFELVDNKEASGANFDYMSIHESKLVYILWKAIQEQQKEIEELKKLIK